MVFVLMLKWVIMLYGVVFDVEMFEKDGFATWCCFLV